MKVSVKPRYEKVPAYGEKLVGIEIILTPKPKNAKDQQHLNEFLSIIEESRELVVIAAARKPYTLVSVEGAAIWNRQVEIKK